MTRFVLSRRTPEGVETATVTVEPMLEPKGLRIAFRARLRVDRPGESTVIEGRLSAIVAAAKEAVTAFEEDGWETVSLDDGKELRPRPVKEGN